MSEVKAGILAVLAIAAVVVLGIVLIVGPKTIERQFSSWRASAYGSDWLVVQYSGMGKVMTHWELHDKSIGNEEHSDGIYFTDDNGNVIHLSGHYVYVQVKDWSAVKKAYLPEPEK